MADAGKCPPKSWIGLTWKTNEKLVIASFGQFFICQAGNILNQNKKPKMSKQPFYFTYCFQQKIELLIFVLHFIFFANFTEGWGGKKLKNLSMMMMIP